MVMITFFSDNLVEEGLQMMHHTNFLKKCLAQPRLLLRTFILGMLLTGCFAVMADLGSSIASAQSLTGQGKPHQSHAKSSKNEGQQTPVATGTPAATGTPVPTENNRTTGVVNNVTGSTHSSGVIPVGSMPVGGPGLPSTGSDPENNPLP